MPALYSTEQLKRQVIINVFYSLFTLLACTGLYTDDEGHVQHSLGGFFYGRCMNYIKGMPSVIPTACFGKPRPLFEKAKAHTMKTRRQGSR